MVICKMMKIYNLILEGEGYHIMMLFRKLNFPWFSKEEKSLKPKLWKKSGNNILQITISAHIYVVKQMPV